MRTDLLFCVFYQKQYFIYTQNSDILAFIFERFNKWPFTNQHSLGQSATEVSSRDCYGWQAVTQSLWELDGTPMNISRKHFTFMAVFVSVICRAVICLQTAWLSVSAQFVKRSDVGVSLQNDSEDMPQFPWRRNAWDDTAIRNGLKIPFDGLFIVSSLCSGRAVLLQAKCLSTIAVTPLIQTPGKRNRFSRFHRY